MYSFITEKKNYKCLNRAFRVEKKDKKDVCLCTREKENYLKIT